MVDVAAVNERIAGLIDRTVTIRDLPATVIEFRADRNWHIASIVTERNLTRRMEANELVVFDAGSNVKDILDQLDAPPGGVTLGQKLELRAHAERMLDESKEELRSGRFREAQEAAREAVTALAQL